MKKILNIPAGLPFARILAAKLLEETDARKEDLSRMLVLLPTRRACRVLREAFLSLTPARALILPRMQPVGDLEEEDLALSMLGAGQGMLDLPPALPPVRRDVLLSKLVQKMSAHTAPDQALALARALGHLMDQVYTEDLDLADLKTLVPEDFADHWQITLTFLEILSVEWPKILAAENRIDAADRRNRLILALAAHWGEHPPDYPVVAAGSTGSIPATRQLLSCVAELEQGRVILPGLDREMEGDSWQALEETHPQFGFKVLLDHMNVARADVPEWGEPSKARITLAREMMRPAGDVGRWADLATDGRAQELLRRGFDGVSLMPCAHERAEAESIALLLREALETPDKTACLITPDRNLAERVMTTCKRWGIALDDSAGMPLDKTPVGVFFQLVWRVVQNKAAPVDVLALLKHALCAPDYRHGVEALDLALRGPRPQAGFAGLRGAGCDDIVEALERAFVPLMETENPSFENRLKAHIAASEALGGDSLWRGGAGQAASTLFSELLLQAPLIGEVDADHYEGILLHFMKQVTVRPDYGMHPRLQILGPMEARLMDADLVILGGLTEGTWPPDAGADPWMSRPMRTSFGLPSKERATGLSAHDFVQGFCSPHVVMTYARRARGAPSVPARWIARLQAVRGAARLEDLDLQSPAEMWARALDSVEGSAVPAKRPAPCPPVSVRPRKLPITAIETWIKDPYSIYARYILRLKKLRPLDEDVDAAVRGSLLHDVLEKFISTYKDSVLPDDSVRILSALARAEIDKRHDDPSVWSFWWPRLSKIFAWFVETENAHRAGARTLALEAEGEMTLYAQGGDFVLSGRADRIDKFDNGGACLIDYKSGGSFTKKGMENGDFPQLPLEALMLAQGGFTGLGDAKTRALAYWVLNGSGAGGKVTSLDDNIDAVLERTEAGVRQLIAAYDDPHTAYVSQPRGDKVLRFNDYKHLARTAEWAVAEGEDESAEEEG